MDSLLDDWDDYHEVASTTKFTGLSTSNTNRNANSDVYDDEDEEQEDQIDSSYEAPPPEIFSVLAADAPMEEFVGLREVVPYRDKLLFVTDDLVVYYFDNRDKTSKEFRLDCKKIGLHKAFMDCTANHVLISLANGDNYYINPTSDNKKHKPVKLEKLKGYLIESVAWERDKATDVDTGNFLFGTTEGTIHSTRFEASSKEVCKYSTMVYDTKESAADGTPIVGLEFDYFPATGSYSFTKYFVMAVTTTRHYQFIGGPTFEDLFEKYHNAPHLQEILSANLDTSELQFLRRNALGRLQPADAFAWITGGGIYHGSFDFGSQDDSVIGEYEILPYDDRSFGPAISVAITEYHTFILFKDRIQIFMQPPGLCSHNDGSVEGDQEIGIKKVYEKIIPSGLGRPIGLRRDPYQETIYIFTNIGVYEIGISDETRDVWQLYLNFAIQSKGKHPEYFDMAYDLVKHDAKKRDLILISKAEYYFNQRDYETSAAVYAKSSKNFEEVSLLFIDSKQKDALKTFLLKKLEHIKRSVDNPATAATQLNCLCVWLTEIYLEKINNLLDANERTKSQAILKEFRQFLTENKEYLNPATTFNLISSHGLMDEVLFYARLIEDYETVIVHHITKGEYDRALEALTHDCNTTLFQEFYYRFAPILMQHRPVEMVDSMINAPFLVPGKLIPALTRYKMLPKEKQGPTNQAIRYLRYCTSILKNKDPAIHNFLLSLYAAEPNAQNLLDFLNPDEPDSNYYDPKYALRVCIENNKLLACVMLYSAMGCYEDAIDLALQCNDINLAKENADKADEADIALKKKLWLKIAKQLVSTLTPTSSKAEVKQAMDLVKESRVIKLEDILPYFPDFVIIDDFQEEICEALKDYNHDIDTLKQDMEEATTAAEAIRNDIKDLRHKFGFVSFGSKCSLCGSNILAREFFLFPCNHVFHSNCMIKEVINACATHKKKKISDLQQNVDRLTKTRETGAELDVTAESKLEELKRELDDMVAPECVLCGDLMIGSIDKPFIDDAETQLIQEWAIRLD